MADISFDYQHLYKLTFNSSGVDTRKHVGSVAWKQAKERLWGKISNNTVSHVLHESVAVLVMSCFILVLKRHFDGFFLYPKHLPQLLHGIKMMKA